MTWSNPRGQAALFPDILIHPLVHPAPAGLTPLRPVRIEALPRNHTRDTPMPANFIRFDNGATYGPSHGGQVAFFPLC